MNGHARRGGVAALVAVPVLTVVGVSAVQVHLARRLYSTVQPSASWLDTTVLPPDSAVSEEGPWHIVTLGDSGMAGVGVHRLDDTLPVLLASRAAALTDRAVHVVNLARSGARTREVLQEQLPLIPRRLDVAIVLVGTNDVTRLSRRGGLARDTEALLSRLNDAGVPVVMCSLPEFKAMRAVPPLVRAGLELQARTVRNVQWHAARKARQVELVDVRGIVGQEFVTDGANMSADRFHPSAVGYARIADALAPAVGARLLARSTGATGGGSG